MNYFDNIFTNNISNSMYLTPNASGYFDSNNPKSNLDIVNEFFVNNWGQGDLGRLEFKQWAINNPDDFMNFYANFKAAIKNRSADTLYTNSIKYNRITERNTVNEIGQEIYNALKGWDRSQIYAALGNSYLETGGWNNMTQSTKDGKVIAKGVFMFESGENLNYQKWLNGRDNSYANQAAYVKWRMDDLKRNPNSTLQTPWDNLKTNRLFIIKTINDAANAGKNKKDRVDVVTDANLEEFINNLANENEAKKYKVRSIWLHRNYTTKQALEDWNSGDVRRATKAFEALFEKAGLPNLDRRMALGELMYNTNYFDSEY